MQENLRTFKWLFECPVYFCRGPSDTDEAYYDVFVISIAICIFLDRNKTNIVTSKYFILKYWKNTTMFNQNKFGRVKGIL